MKKNGHIYWNPSVGDPLYTTNPGSEMLNGYTYEGNEGCLYRGMVSTGTVALYRYYNVDLGDHFYTTNGISEVGTTTRGQTGRHGYMSEGIAGYCFDEYTSETTALNRYFRGGSNADHFYTTNYIAEKE